MKKQRKLVIGFLLVLAVLVSGITFAYWANGINVTQAEDETNTIQIGSGQSVSTTVTITNQGNNLEDKNFVPTSRKAEHEDNTDTVTVTFSVTWAGASDTTSAADATAPLTATAELTGTQKDGETALTSTELALFTVSIFEAVTITYGQSHDVEFIVMFAFEPSDYAQYLLVAEATLTLTVTFTIGTVTPA